MTRTLLAALALLGATLTATVDWTITSHSESQLTMTGGDGVESMQWGFSYQLERTVTVLADGIESRTTLRLACPRFAQHPISWFAHPFFAHSALDATSVTLPGAELVTNTRLGAGNSTSLSRDAAGQWRFAPGNARATFGGLWGATPELLVHLDPALGGGQVGVRVDRPLDHVVVWANELVFSPEPKLCRLWLDGERASWTIRYRFQK